MSKMTNIEGQNQVSPCSSHRILVAKKIAAAENHAALPIPGRPNCINTRRSGNVVTMAAIAQDNVTLLSDCSSTTYAPNILNSLVARILHPKAPIQQQLPSQAPKRFRRVVPEFPHLPTSGKYG